MERYFVPIVFPDSVCRCSDSVFSPDAVSPYWVVCLRSVYLFAARVVYSMFAIRFFRFYGCFFAFCLVYRENVAGIISISDNGLKTFLSAFAE